MAKPIFVVGFPAKKTNGDINEISDHIKKALGDEYYVLLYTNDEIYTPKFEAFYEKDFNEVKFEELKTIIQKAVNPIKGDKIDES